MKAIRFIILYSILQLVVQIGDAQSRRALLIGISNYDTKTTMWNPIHGTNDIALIRTVLKKKGFTNITEVKNSSATYQGICTAWDKLISQTTAGDIVYIHMSGHGQPVEDYDGDEKGKDGWDESFVPYDAPKKYEKGVYEGNRHLTDDTINKYIERLRKKVGANGIVYLSIDACHAGDSYRDDDDNKENSEICIADSIDITLDEVSPILSTCSRGSADGFHKTKDKTYSASDVVVKSLVQIKPASKKSHLVVLESCLSTQRSYELKLKMKGHDFYCGPLSYVIYKVLQQSSLPLNDVAWVKTVRNMFTSVLPSNNNQKLVIETTEKSLCK